MISDILYQKILRDMTMNDRMWDLKLQIDVQTATNPKVE